MSTSSAFNWQDPFRLDSQLSCARIVGTAALELREKQGRFGLATMCIGVGQGIAMAIERV